VSWLTFDTVGGRPTVRGFDHDSPEYAAHWREMAREFHATGRPIAWGEASDGGYWLLGSLPEVQRVATDYETFTSVNDLDGTGNGGRGQRIPQMQMRLFLGESDPPEHTERRALEAPFFAPKSLRKWRPVMQHFLDEAIDQVIEQGHCDLNDDILIPTTARTTLHVVGYDANDWHDTAVVAHRISYMSPEDPEYPSAAYGRMVSGFSQTLAERAREPKGDILSALGAAVERGVLEMHQAESMMYALIFGGFDTTVSLTGHALLFLDQHPEHLDRFRNDPQVRRNFIDELLRLHAPTGHVARTAIRPTEILGQEIKPGERVYMWLAAANLDPLTFAEPDTFDPERANAREHVSFSAGSHRCLGSPLAKIEIEEMLTTIFDRLDGVRIDRAHVRPYPSIGNVTGFVDLPATFAPGERVNSVHPESAAAADRS
jgi:cytochrome P450